MTIRNDWKFEELEELYARPLLELMAYAQEVHRKFHKVGEVQVCSLISIKTGGCPEDCKYCAQSSRYQTATSAQPLMQYKEVLQQAKRAIAEGASRICLGAAWREVRASGQFEEVLRMVRGIAELGVEVCCTLGMLKPQEAERLKAAGLYAYNHNLDSSEQFYKTIITTRTYQDRLKTLDTVQKAGLSVCSGAILGMGEKVQDRLEFLQTLANRNPHPDSVPINLLTPILGTPLENMSKVPIWEMVRMVATTRVVLPHAMVRLSSGRDRLSYEEQALCFLAGANSIFSGEKLLTVANCAPDRDKEMFEILGLHAHSKTG